MNIRCNNFEMKYWLYTIFSVAVTFSITLAQQTSQTKVVAHRGAWKNTKLPQNSMASLESAITMGCHASECDIWMTRDSVLVVNHDPDFYGLRIEDSSYDELSVKQHPNGERISTLEQFLRRIVTQRNTRIVLDIKPSTISKERSLAVARRSLDMVLQMKAQDLTDYIFFDYDACLLLKKLEPQAHVAYLNGDKSPTQVADDGLSCLDYNYRIFQKNESWLSDARERGLTLNVWTVNDEALMTFFLKEKVDFITTDEPELLLRLVR